MMAYGHTLTDKITLLHSSKVTVPKKPKDNTGLSMVMGLLQTFLSKNRFPFGLEFSSHTARRLLTTVMNLHCYNNQKELLI